MKKLLVAVSMAFALATAGIAWGEPAAVNLNTATVKQLMQLKGVGKDKAEAIIAYRAKNGQFSKVEELAKVKGIGKTTVEKNKQMLAVQ